MDVVPMRRKEEWERHLEEGEADGEEDDLDLNEYYFRKTGVRIFYTGRIFVGFGNALDFFEVDLEKQELVGVRLPCSHFTLMPRRHGRGCFRLSDMEMFAQLDCKMPVVKEYPSCGHKIAVTCSEFRSMGGEQVLKICPYRCERTEMKWCGGHICYKRCGEDCEPCLSIKPPAYPNCPRKHYNHILCFVSREREKGVVRDLMCVEQIFPRKAPSCGHVMRVKCFEADRLTVEQLDRRCNVPCRAVLKCGHNCSGNCAECFTFRLHKKCGRNCDKTLICDHKCLKTCGEGCGSCGRSCWRSCPHKQCQLECGVPCKWECSEPCDNVCEHGSCTLKCGEPCDRAPCQEPCPLKIAACGHDCVGFCGEKCPPVCRYCTPEKLAVGALLTLGEVEEDDRFIYLEQCGHCVESSAMDQWMAVQDEQIVLKRCPICRSRLGWMSRYSGILKENWGAVESVKERIFGDEWRIEEALERIEKKLLEASTSQTAEFYPAFPRLILEKIERDDGLGSRRVDLNWTAVRWIEWIFDEWVYASSQVRLCAGMAGIHEDVDDVERRWRALFWVIKMREWPLENQEMLSYFREKQRLEDYTKVCRVLKEAREKDEQFFNLTFSTALARENFARVMECLREQNSYDPLCQDKFDEAFQRFSGQLRVTLAISEQERLEIVEAFGGEGSGNWFKCPNGHVYVITECAGAVTRSICPDCRAEIGGDQHRVLDNNHLAVEMDGAEEPAFERRVRRAHEAIREADRREQEQIRAIRRRNQEQARLRAVRDLEEAVRLTRQNSLRRIREAVCARGRGRGERRN